MPTYEYVCRDCGQHLEVVQSFTDPALSTCELCGGTLRKVFGSVGIVFKGSGFYKTDSRSSSGTPQVTKAAPAETKTETAKTEDTASKTDTTAKPSGSETISVKQTEKPAASTTQVA
ncbi:MAG: FmdB family transcriptional regulator [Firmicutes bacterium]|nr:FmdB family transcriptional regulator [Bacillota bacterium]